MNFRPNVNFGWAFDQLKGALKQADEHVEKSNLENYAYALAVLRVTVRDVLTVVEEPDPADDLKEIEVFKQSETGKEIDEAIDREIENNRTD